MTSEDNKIRHLDKIKSFYDEEYYKHTHRLTNNEISFHYRSLVKKIGVKQNDKILDVACGLGDWLAACKNVGAIVSGVDISDKAIAICKKNIDEGSFFVSPAENLPFPDHQFDFVTCLGSIEHFVNPKQALNEMVRVAKKEAIFLLLVPNRDFLTRKLGLYSGTNQRLVKEDVRTLDEWKSLFEESGLEIKQRWRDLHVLTWKWILASHWYLIPVRLAQALSLCFWPLKWQYQVYHLCQLK